MQRTIIASWRLRGFALKFLRNLFSEEAEAVEADEDGASFMQDDGDPKRDPSEKGRCCSKENDNKGKCDVLSQDLACFSCFFDKP